MLAIVPPFCSKFCSLSCFIRLSEPCSSLSPCFYCKFCSLLSISFSFFIGIILFSCSISTAHFGFYHLFISLVTLEHNLSSAIKCMCRNVIEQSMQRLFVAPSNALMVEAKKNHNLIVSSFADDYCYIYEYNIEVVIKIVLPECDGSLQRSYLQLKVEV